MDFLRLLVALRKAHNIFMRERVDTSGVLLRLKSEKRMVCSWGTMLIMLM